VIENYCTIIFSLSENLGAEKEFRLAKVFQMDIGDKDSKRKAAIPPESIKSIVLGPSIDTAFQNSVAKAGKTMNPSVEFFKVVSGGEYKLLPLKLRPR
jgi:hypothetical protein